jgi:hypothetical protein
VLVIPVASRALQSLFGRGTGRVGDSNEEVFTGKDIDRRKGRHLFAGVVGIGNKADRFEDCKSIVGRGVDLHALIFVAGVFDVERMKIVLSSQLIELGIVGVFELIPGHDDSEDRVSLGRNKPVAASL